MVKLKSCKVGWVFIVRFGKVEKNPCANREATKSLLYSTRSPLTKIIYLLVSSVRSIYGTLMYTFREPPKHVVIKMSDSEKIVHVRHESC